MTKFSKIGLAVLTNEQAFVKIYYIISAFYPVGAQNGGCERFARRKYKEELMRSGFKRFRRKINRGAFFKSLMLGLSVGLLSAALVLLLGKLNVIDDSIILALAVGGGVFVAVFIPTLIILTPRKKTAARLMDKEMKLGEKAETMIAFLKSDSEMAELQRRKAEGLLSRLPSDFYTVKRLWVYFVTLLLSLALCSFAYLVPDKQVPPPEPPPETPFELTEWQETALLNLIEYVEESELCDTAKASVTAELEQLLEELRRATLDKQMRALVIGAIKNINTAIDTANSFDEITDELKLSGISATLALAEAIGTPSAAVPTEKFIALRALLAEGEVTEINSVIVMLGTDVAITLGRISSRSDSLSDALESFSDGLFDISDNLSDYDGQSLQVAIDSLFESFKISLGAALAEQSTNEEVGLYTVNRLMEIFGITASELPPEVEEEIKRPGSDNEEDEPPEEDEEQKGDSGGYGSGDMVYGSDDVIYYPDEERYVQYGEVINEYHAKITEKILAGEIPPELAASIQKYFDGLYDGAAKEDGGGE